jgi:hypothetical protein
MTIAINFIYEEFQFSEPKKSGSLGDGDFGFLNIANFELNGFPCKATFWAGGLTHIANPSWTISNAKAEKALMEYLKLINPSKITEPIHVEFTLQNNVFSVIE